MFNGSIHYVLTITSIRSWFSLITKQKINLEHFLNYIQSIKD